MTFEEFEAELFNVEEFRQHGFKEDIQKKNPTLLYYPKSLK